MSQSNPTDHEISVYSSEYVLTGDKSKSWRKTFPNSKAIDKSVWENACKFHDMTKVLSRIVELQAETASKDAEEFDLSAAKLKEVLKGVIDAGMEKDANGKYAGLSAVTQAVVEFNRMNGNHAATKQEITGKDGKDLPTSVVVNVVRS